MTKLLRVLQASEQLRLSSTQKILWLTLLAMGADSGVRLTYEELSLHSGVSIRNISENLGCLYRRGVLTRKRSGRANLYTIPGVYHAI